MSERELLREVAAALKALDQAESLAAEYAAIRGEDDEVAATKIRAVAMNLERWARASHAAEAIRREALEEAAKVVEPTNAPPCDCITLHDEEWWMPRCDCRNGGDADEAQSWCTSKNEARRIRALSPPVKDTP